MDRYLSRFFDGCDVVFAILALIALAGGLMSGYIPRDLSLWVEAIGGLFIVIVVLLILWDRLRKR